MSIQSAEISKKHFKLLNLEGRRIEYMKKRKVLYK